MSIDAVQERKNYYLGETANQLRHGFGVYFYENKFFRYEGDWVKGKKHGHGKLIMADGSYYEGEFKDGEIEGHGFRKWQSSGNSYSGEFSRGEMHGHGVMNYADGSQYQGEFCTNQRHGNGILQDREGNEYEGSWYKNKKHGQGIQIYGNGDEYEGHFVDGVRHGDGELNCADGTIYEGQWRADLFNGIGLMIHASQLNYQGMWVNGRPENEASSVAVVLASGQKFIDVIQGRKFSVNLQVLDSKGNQMTGEHGREFQISAGYRFSQKNTQSQSLLELIEDIDSKPITTPYGYDVLPYPLVDSINESEETEDNLGVRKKSRQSPVTSRVFGGETIHEHHENDKDSLKPDENENIEEADATSTLSGSKGAASEEGRQVPDATSAETLDAGTEEEEELETGQLQPPATQRSLPDGLVEFGDLLLPAAPPNFRPFGSDVEIGPDGKVSSSASSSPRRGAAGGGSLSSSGFTSARSSSVASTRSSSEKRRSKGSRTASAASTSSSTIDGKGAKNAKSKTSVEERGAKPAEKGSSPKKRSREKHKERRGNSGKNSKDMLPPEPSDSERALSARQDFLDSNYAIQGEYVVIVQDVTQPPFLGTRLDPAFALVRVAPNKKTGKKPPTKK